MIRKKLMMGFMCGPREFEQRVGPSITRRMMEDVSHVGKEPIWVFKSQREVLG